MVPLSTMLITSATARRPYLLSMAKDWMMVPPVPAARLSPRVSAPNACSLLATADANLYSPPSEDMKNLNSGALDWLARCDRPICCTA